MAVVVAVCALGACGSAATPQRAASTTTAPVAAGPDPGTVAVRFTRALFGGDFDRARRYVAPDSRNALLVVTAGLRDASVSQRDLAAGSLRVHGTSATAILTGTLCSSHSVKRVTRTSHDCITNRDPHSDNPVFRVGLKLGSDRQWRVSYGRPRASGAGPVARTP